MESDWPFLICKSDAEMKQVWGNFWTVMMPPSTSPFKLFQQLCMSTLRLRPENIAVRTQQQSIFSLLGSLHMLLLLSRIGGKNERKKCVCSASMCTWFFMVERMVLVTPELHWAVVSTAALLLRSHFMMAPEGSMCLIFLLFYFLFIPLCTPYIPSFECQLLFVCYCCLYYLRSDCWNQFRNQVSP